MTSTSNEQPTRLHRDHQEPEKPLVYEPPDLYGRKHVEKVTGEYRVREDECLADKLQTEEFKYHFGKNKDERQFGKIDLKTAKDIYLREIEESGLLSKEEMKRVLNQDAALARDLDNRINENMDLESQRKQAVELQDEEFAKYLEARERQKYEDERKKRLERRIAQDRADAERLQKSLNEEANREEELAQGLQKLDVKSPQKGGWAIDFEVGASLGEETTHEQLQDLKNEEITRRIQLQETEKQKQLIEEERDRKIAMKLQKAEAEDYRKKQQEKQLRRAQSDVRPSNENSAISNVQRKRLQSVDAKGNPIRDPMQDSDRDTGDAESYRNRQRAQTTPSRSQSERIHHKNSSRTPNENRDVYSEESLYLQAVDASPGQRRQTNDVRKRTNQHPDEAKIKEQQQMIYDQSRRESSAEHARKDDERRDSHRSSRSSKSSRGSQSSQKDHERRLVDDQMALRQQAHSIEQIHQSNSDRHNRQRRSVKSKDGHDTTWDLQVGLAASNEQQHQHRSPGPGNPRQNAHTQQHHDTSEEKRHKEYNNVARVIDPTYQTIGPPGKNNGQVGMLETETSLSDIHPVPVIQNVKRPSKEDAKKKKKWFSKKEK